MWLPTFVFDCCFLSGGFSGGFLYCRRRGLLVHGKSDFEIIEFASCVKFAARVVFISQLYIVLNMDYHSILVALWLQRWRLRK